LNGACHPDAESGLGAGWDPSPDASAWEGLRVTIAAPDGSRRRFGGVIAASDLRDTTLAQGQAGTTWPARPPCRERLVSVAAPQVVLLGVRIACGFGVGTAPAGGWAGGAGALVCFFRASRCVRNRLLPNGCACQWLRTSVLAEFARPVMAGLVAATGARRGCSRGRGRAAPRSERSAPRRTRSPWRLPT